METRGETVLATHATAHTLEEVRVPAQLLDIVSGPRLAWI